MRRALLVGAAAISVAACGSSSHPTGAVTIVAGKCNRGTTVITLRNPTPYSEIVRVILGRYVNTEAPLPARATQTGTFHQCISNYSATVISATVVTHRPGVPTTPSPVSTTP